MSLPDLLESVKSALPVDVVYRVIIKEDYTVAYEPVGILSLSYKAIEDVVSQDQEEVTIVSDNDTSSDSGGDGVGERSDATGSEVGEEAAVTKRTRKRREAST
jgi:hypothetical protein